MANKIVFSETQKFNQWWLWILLIVLWTYFLYGAFQQIFLGISFGEKPMSDMGLMLISMLFTAMIALFKFLKLETLINSDGIYVRFFPFHFQFKFYSFEVLEKSYIRKYSPKWEYGGWGLRYGMFGNGKAFNIAGNQGLQLVFKDGSKLLIGTQNPKELVEVLKNLGKY